MASLTCKVGVAYLESIEDAVQSALMKAVHRWPIDGEPENPTAWLFKVAQNALLDDIRQQQNRQRILDNNAFEFLQDSVAELSVSLSHDLKDDLLQMLFICCDKSIPSESQLVFALKTLCGFSVAEIALRIFSTEANVYKRFTRAKAKLNEHANTQTELSLAQQIARRPAVIKVLYLLFTEGYLSSHAQTSIRKEMCLEAIRLTTALANHPAGNCAETSALLALMHLHFARTGARQDSTGDLLLLEEQDRTLWDSTSIEQGLAWLSDSARGTEFSRYHAEAGIAAEHCLAPSFEQTQWHKIVECYELLESIAPAPLHTLNKAVAIAQWQGPEAALAVLNALQPPAWLENSYLWAAVHADLYRQTKHAEQAEYYRILAVKKAPTEAVRQLLVRRLS